MPRIFCPPPLASGQALALPASAARHVQVLRMQPGGTLTLFDGSGGEWQATITHMGRSDVQVQVGGHNPVEREAPRAVHLALGVPANERMDWLVEKATELGVTSIQPLMTERTVLRLSGERAEKKRAHWQAIAEASCEQCGRNRVPQIHAVATLPDWLDAVIGAGDGPRWVLSLDPAAAAPSRVLASVDAVHLLSGPEGGLSPAEEQLTRSKGWLPVSLGTRVLRAETAPLALLAALTLNQ